MNTKIKATPQKIYIITLITFLLVNLVLLFFAAQYVYKNVYQTMFMSRDDLLLHSVIKVEDIDLNKFENVVSKIKEKQNKPDIKLDYDVFF